MSKNAHETHSNAPSIQRRIAAHKKKSRRRYVALTILFISYVLLVAMRVVDSRALQDALYFGAIVTFVLGAHLFAKEA